MPLLRITDGKQYKPGAIQLTVEHICMKRCSYITTLQVAVNIKLSFFPFPPAGVHVGAHIFLLIWLTFDGLLWEIKCVICQNLYNSTPRSCTENDRERKNYRDRSCSIKAQWSYRCAVREGFRARRMAVPECSRPFLLETPPWRKKTQSKSCAFNLLITTLMSCHAWLMDSKGNHWSRSIMSI